MHSTSSKENPFRLVAQTFARDLPYFTGRLFLEFGQHLQHSALKALGGETPAKGAEGEDFLPTNLLNRKGIPFGTITTRWRRVAVKFPANDYHHKLVVGGTGTGKTEALCQYVVNRPGGVAYFCNDDGESVDRILAALPEERLAKTVVLDHSDKCFPLPLGFGSDCNTSDPFIQDERAALWQGFFETNFSLEETYMTSEILAYACRLVFACPGATFYDVFKVVIDPTYRYSLLNRLSRNQHLDIVKYWESADQKVLLSNARAFLYRARSLFRDRLLRYTLGVPAQGLKYQEWIDESYTVLVRCPESLGAQTTRIIMAIHALSFWNAALERDSVQQKMRVPFVLVADEPHTWLFNNASIVDSIFSKARKYGFGMICSFQSFEQIAGHSTKLLKVMLDNYPDLLVFRTSQRQLPIKGFDVEAIPKYHFVGRVAGSEYFLAKTLGRIKPIRGQREVASIIEANKVQFNQHHERIRYYIERRENSWEGRINIPEPLLESQRSGSKPSANLDSHQEISKYSTSYTIIE